MFKKLMLTSALVSLSTLLNTYKASAREPEMDLFCDSLLVKNKTAHFYVWSLTKNTPNRSAAPDLKDPVSKPATETSVVCASEAKITGPIITGPLTETPEGVAILYFGSEQNPKNVQRFKLTSPTQMFDLGQRFLDLAFANKADLVLRLCTNAYELPPALAIGDIERFWFRNITAQSLAHLRLAEANVEAEREHYEHIVFLMDAYERFFKDLKCNPITREKIDTNFIDLCNFACKAHGHLSVLYDADPSMSNEATYNITLKSIRYGEDYIDRLKTLVKKAKNEGHTELTKLLEVKQSALPMIKNDLIKAYFSAYQFAYIDNKPHLYKAYRAKIEAFCSELRKSAEFKEESKKIRDMLDLFDKSHTDTSGALANYKLAKAAEKNVALLQLAENQYENKEVSKSELMNNKWKRILLQIDLDIKTAIAKKTIAQPNAVSFDSLAFIAELEKTIFETIDSGKSIISETLNPGLIMTKTEHFSVISLRDYVAEMRNIYREYRQIFGSDKFDNAYWKYPMAFLCAGDIDGALARVNAFEAILAEQYETPNVLGRCIAALVKSLHGDYADLLDLESEASGIIAKRNAARQENKQKTHSAKIDSIRTTQKEHAETEAARSKAEAMAAEQRRAGMISRKQAAATIDSSTPQYDFVTTGLSKAEKRQRHDEAQRNKIAETARIHKDVATGDRKMNATLASSDTSESDSEILTSKLSELYNLRGVARDVDEKIENASWDFTRQDLVAYYEAMGCEKRSGKGSHEIIELGSSFVFTKNGELVSVLSDFGGALTLPRWDGVVPYYLRKQIQGAREKLARFAEKAIM